MSGCLFWYFRRKLLSTGPCEAVRVKPVQNRTLSKTKHVLGNPFWYTDHTTKLNATVALTKVKLLDGGGDVNGKDSAEYLFCSYDLVLVCVSD